MKNNKCGMSSVVFIVLWFASAPVFAQKAESYYQQGLLAVSQTQVRKAEGAFARAINSDPSHLQARQSLVELYFVTRRIEEGLKAVEEALGVFPSDATLWVFKGLFSTSLGDMTAAQAAYEQALALAPDDIQVLREASGFYFQQGDRTTAEALKQRRDVLVNNATNNSAMTSGIPAPIATRLAPAIQ